MNIVIVEDSEQVQDSLKRLLADLPQAEILGTARAEDEAVDLILACQPDTVILDLALAPGSGLNVLRRIRAGGCGARVVMLSNHREQAYRDACLAAGADAYFDKSHDINQLLKKLMSWLPPMPANEETRLHALRMRHVLDTPEEDVFDQLARLTAQVTGTTIALVSLVDEARQWFKSHIGLATRETSRTVSFCAHTINQASLMEVEDATKDPRFTDNPLVRGALRIRFYAGVPLIMPGGEAIGTLCVIDQKPRRLSEEQKRGLAVLAHQVVTELELRQRIAELQWEVERRRAAEVQLSHLATRDPLTGLPNRNALMDRLKQGIKLADRGRHPLGFMFLDLDRFKLINDSLGHSVGDLLLQQVGERLTAALRESDTVARLGGDEFAVVLPRLEGAEQATQVAEKLIAAINAPMEVNGHHLRVDCSVGIALYPAHGASEEFVIRHADLAMYHAKGEGSNQFRVYQPEMDKLAKERLTLEWDLREALERHELTLHFQPQVSPRGGELAGVEALVRWNHPRLGLVSPLRFIHLAEETGLIWELGRQVIDMAMAQMADWRRDGLKVPRMAINLSPFQLRPELAGLVRDAQQAHGLPPDCIELEITESALTSDGPQVLELLDTLHQLGISLAVDDFGVGYSSLALLRRLPLDTLKIDKSFIDEVVGNRQDATIVRAVLDMAHGLGLRVVAEGVESEAQRDLLQAMACDDLQGYLYSRPLPAAEFAAWMAARTPRRLPA